jgi:hypothetical protein
MFNQRLNTALDYDADWELVPQIVETVGTGVAPDLLEELDGLGALEARIEDLEVLRAALLDSKGMSQQFALEAQRLLPEFDGQRPIGYYTVNPSKTRYGVALEELSAGVWSLIAAGIAAIVMAIVKFFKWLMGRKDAASPEEAVKDSIAELEETKKLLKRCETLVNEAVTSTSGQYIYLKDAPNREVYSLDKAIEQLFKDNAHDQRIARFLQTKDPFFHDIVHRGEYSTEMAQLSVLFSNLQVVLRQRLTALEAVSRLNLTDDSSTADAANLRALQVLTEPMVVRFKEVEQTLPEIKQYIYNLAHATSVQEVEGPISFDQLFQVMSQAFNREDVVESLSALNTTMPLLENTKNELQSLERTSGNYHSDGKRGQHSTMLGQALRQAIFVLGQDVASMISITGELMSFQNRLLHMASNAAGFAAAIATRLAVHGLNQDGGNLARWTSVAHELKAVDKEFKRFVKPM